MSGKEIEIDTRVPEDADRDFVAGAFVVKEGKVLFLNHKKYGIWLQPGGHIEEGETPDEAAVRETKEETGLEVEVVGEEREFDGNFDQIDLPPPFNVNLHEVEEGHWHYDLQYVVRVIGETDHYEYDDEDIKWLSEEEIKSDEYEMPPNIRKSAVEAIRFLEE